jgi:putative hydrolase of HD superfamily
MCADLYWRQFGCLGASARVRVSERSSVFVTTCNFGSAATLQDLHNKIAFVLEIEKLKAVLRSNKPLGLARYENAAEHSWQVALTALLFLDEVDGDLDSLKILKMLLIHDIVEIDAGDINVFDEAARRANEAAELAAARRIFGLLPQEMGQELFDLWQEFELGASAEARYAKAMDRLIPVLQNLHHQGESWLEHAITMPQVLQKTAQVRHAGDRLWAYVEAQIKTAPFWQT